MGTTLVGNIGTDRDGEDVFHVRIHGRGGQGVVAAAEMLSVAAFDGGRHAQAFLTFGSERTGAPVTAYYGKGCGSCASECPAGAISMVSEEI